MSDPRGNENITSAAPGGTAVAPHPAEPQARPWGTGWIIGLVVLAGLALTGAFIGGALPRQKQTEKVRAEAEETANALPRVTVAVAHQAAADDTRTLPGNCMPLLDTGIFARTTGYLKRRLVDIGDHVTEGQLLAEIATPEIDAQLEQARATVLAARSNLTRDRAQEEYARSEQNRLRTLARTQAASQEEFESKVAAARVASATVESDRAQIKVDEANVQRLIALQSFQKLTAPFSGIITARNVDPGALVQADAPTATHELFHLMRTDVLRVLVNVPQVFATAMWTGQGATLFRRETPRQEFTGKVARTADALDPNTRTLLTEVHVPNPDNLLRPGMYLQVRFHFTREVYPIRIPSAALVTRPDGPHVGVVDDKHIVHYRKVQVGRDYGAEIEVATGLSAGDIVVVHPGDELTEGTEVDPIPMPKAKM